MTMRNTTLIPMILAAAVWAAACGSSEPEAVTGAAPAEEPSQPAAPTPAEADPADGTPTDGGGTSDPGDSAASGSDEVDEGSGVSSSSSSDGGGGASDSGDSAASGSDEVDEGSGVSSSSSSDDTDADASPGAGGDIDSEPAPDSPDDTVSVSDDQIVGDGADISDPGPSNSGGPAPPQDRRRLAHVTAVAFQVLESWPMQVIVEVSGELPDPCHELWWEVAVDGTTYDLEVWSVSPPADSDMACAAVIEPFTENVPLGGGFVSDDYTVIVNGEPHTLSF